MTDGGAHAALGQGLAALQAGRAREARDHLSRAVAAGQARGAYHLLAQACRLLGDDAGERAALDHQLKEEPRHLAALLLMAEHLARAGDDRGASSYYRTAFFVGRSPGTTLSETLNGMLQRGSQFVAEADRRFEAHLATILRSGEIEDGIAGLRLRQSIDLLLGRSQLYLQQPSMFYFPGLPQRQYYEREEFPWIAEMEQATRQIGDEIMRVVAAADAFEPYIQRNPDRPSPANHLLEDPSWGAYYLWRSGELLSDHAVQCPVTMAALEAAPIPIIQGRSPMALFSRLRPGTHIKPHNGLLNTRLICHLPIMVPPGCALRVGNETREWRLGEMLIFDDSIEHEAWNRSNEDRIVLLFEIWRPELAPHERRVLTKLFQAIAAYDEGH